MRAVAPRRGSGNVGERPPEGPTMLTRLVCVAALAAGTGLAAADDLELNVYASAEGKYKVLLPGEVKTSDEKMAAVKADKKADKKIGRAHV